MLCLKDIFFFKGIEEAAVDPRKIVQSFFGQNVTWRCLAELGLWDLPFSAALKKFLSRTQPYHLYCPSSSCFSESSNWTQLVLLSISSRPWEPILVVSVNRAEAEKMKPIVMWTQEAKDVWKFYKFGLEDENLSYPHYPPGPAELQAYALIIWRNISFTTARAPPFSKHLHPLSRAPWQVHQYNYTPSQALNIPWVLDFS